LKWTFAAGMWVHGSAAVGDDGTVYIGTDSSFYALCPNNGTIKWKCDIVGSFWSTPVIDEDGIIYIGDSSGYFYAIRPDGTIKWKFNTGGGFWFGASAAISAEGTIYFGTTSFTGGSGNFFALYHNGTEKWRFHHGDSFSSPAIGKDGTVYMTFCVDEVYGGGIHLKGYLYAFGTGPLEAEANGPYYGLISEPVQFEGSSGGGYSSYSYHWDFGDGQTSEEQNQTHTYTNHGNYTVTLIVTDAKGNTISDTTWAWIQTTNTPPDIPTINGSNSGKPGVSYDYHFMSSDQDGTPIWYYVEWGDGSNSGWVGQYNSGEEITLNHSWSKKGTYIVKCKVKDFYGAESDWGTLSVTMPKSKQVSKPLFLRLLEKFPLLEKLFSHHIFR
jgi:hypothetical protein